MDIGASLRDARERRGLSLETVSVKTKIRVDLLRALEAGAFERLPAPIFVRGFIRACAREVGVDPEALVSQYQPGPVAVESPADAAAAGAAENATVPETASSSEDRTAAAVIPGAIRPWLVAAVVLVTLTLYVLALPLLTRPAAVARPAAASVPAAAPVESAPTPVATSGQSLRVTIRVQRACWVSATADDRRAIFRTMRPSEMETIEVTSDLVLRVGDAGALSWTIDGAAAKPLGRSGQPVSARITRDNYRDFVAGRQ